MFEGPPTGELEDFTAALAPSAYFFAGDFREVTDRFVKGRPGGAVLPPRQTVGSAIFLIHGANVGRREEVVRVLEQLLGEEIDVVVLHEQPHRGRTLIEKFEETAAAAKYAVALLTGDETAQPVASGETRLRARQNVVFELGSLLRESWARPGRCPLRRRCRGAFRRQRSCHRPLDEAGGWKVTLAGSCAMPGLRRSSIA